MRGSLPASKLYPDLHTNNDVDMDSEVIVPGHQKHIEESKYQPYKHGGMNPIEAKPKPAWEEPAYMKRDE